MPSDFWKDRRRVAIVMRNWDHKSASEIAKMIGDGCTRGQVIGIYHRTIGTVFPCTAIKLKRERRKTARRRAEKKARQRRQIAEIKSDLSRMSRNDAIVCAYKRGIGPSVIGKACGMARQSVSYIVGQYA